MEGDAEAVTKALAATLNDPDSDVRAVAAEYLGHRQELDPASLDLLRKAMQNDPIGKVRVKSLYAMVQLGQHDADVVDSLMSCLSDASPNVRTAAAAASGDLRPPDDTIIQALEVALNERNISVQLAAAESLAKLGRGGGVFVSALDAALAGQTQGIRSYVAELLRFGNRRDVVIRELGADKDPVVRARAARILGEVGDKGVSVALALDQATGDPEAAVRQAAANALRKIKTPP